ncbi:MAG TPA: LytTR family DNA-binding domain-containing protein [Allosphingosinicella sp.]
MAEQTPLRVMIVDDEPLAIERLQLLLGRCEGVTLVGTASDGEAAMEAAEAAEPDLLLLDIAMPGKDGIEVARALAASKADPAIIFVTAFDNFAVAAFDVAAVDYLMKPVQFDRLTGALERARAAIGEGRARQPAVPRYVQEFWVPDQLGLVRLPVREIDRITTDRDDMRLHVGRRNWMVYRTAGAPEDGLDPELFIQVDSSTLLRRDAIAGMARDAGGDWLARLRSGEEVRMGHDHVSGVKRLLGRG